MMKEENSYRIKTLFLDIGGVLLTNGWDYVSRCRAFIEFDLDHDEIEGRHALAFETFEMGRMSLDEYLDLVVFYKQRSFSQKDFKDFMFSQSQPLEGSLAFFLALKERYHLKVFAVSNEGRELNEFRIATFGLDTLFDAYISSCYIHMHKPDKAMLQLACDIAHTAPQQSLYIDDRPELTQLAADFGCHTIRFNGLKSTQASIEAIFHQII